MSIEVEKKDNLLDQSIENTKVILQAMGIVDPVIPKQDFLLEQMVENTKAIAENVSVGSGGGSGVGTNDYNSLINLPKINDVMLIGNKTPADYGLATAKDVEALQNQLGVVEDENIIGVQVDYKNNIFTRLAGAKGKNAGADFNKYSFYSNRKRCTVADDGSIIAFYGDTNYVEDGSNGQVQVRQPKFYYKVVPLELEPNTTGIGYKIIKANYYLSATPRNGFKLHPAFIVGDRKINYYLIGANEASLYDTSASAYILDDAQVADFNADKVCSIVGAKPISGTTQNLTRANFEKLCKNRGSNWHTITVQVASAEQLLMLVEYASFDMQRSIGKGVVDLGWTGEHNDAIVTGGTSSLGNASGMASGTNGRVSVSYRGVENFWGNIWSFVNAVNIYGNGLMGGGEPYYCSDLNFVEDTHTGNYVGAGFTVTNANGYIKYFGYSTECDWLFMCSEVGGTDSIPVGSYQYVTSNLNGHRIGLLGGIWGSSWTAGPVCWALGYGSGYRYCYLGGRSLCIPTEAQSNLYVE